MKKAKIRAAVSVAACALYMMLAELLEQIGLRFPSVFALILGMICASDCFIHGREYETERQRNVFERRGTRVSSTFGAKMFRCAICGCPEFSKVADRLVCICCGAVAEVEDDGKDQMS